MLGSPCKQSLLLSPCWSRRRQRGSQLMPTLWGHRSPDVCTSQSSWALSIQPKIPEISVGTSNGTDYFGLVRPEYSGPALNVVHFDRSGHFGRSDRNVLFHLTKLLSPIPLFCILLTKTITKRAVAWVGSVQLEWARGISEISNLFFECKHPIIDKSIVITEPVVPSTRLLGSKLYPTNMQSMLNKDLTRSIEQLTVGCVKAYTIK